MGQVRFKDGDRVIILAPSESQVEDEFSLTLMVHYAGYRATVVDGSYHPYSASSASWCSIAIDHCTGKHLITAGGLRLITGLDVMLELLPK